VCSIVCPCIIVILVVLFTSHFWAIIIASDLFSGVIAAAAASMWTSMYVNCTSQYSGSAGTSVDYDGSILFSPSLGPDLPPALVYGPGFPILWAASGSRMTILVVSVVVAIFFLYFLIAASTALPSRFYRPP